eukprot:Platyproteum_vivax@DN6546_c0_g1_i1.p1
MFDNEVLQEIATKCRSIIPIVSRIKKPAPPPSYPKNQRQASVIIPLCNQNGVCSVMFTVRTNKVSTHKNEVCFPGGHLESTDKSPSNCRLSRLPNILNLAAAFEDVYVENLEAVRGGVREMWEEIGLGSDDVNILGVCEKVVSTTGTLVTPVLGFVKEDVGDLAWMSVNSEEVEKVFCLSVEQLLDPKYRKSEKIHRGQVAVFYGGPQKVWGLTAFILEGVLHEVLLPALKDKLQHSDTHDSPRDEEKCTFSRAPEETRQETKQETGDGTPVSKL